MTFLFLENKLFYIIKHRISDINCSMNLRTYVLKLTITCESCIRTCALHMQFDITQVGQLYHCFVWRWSLLITVAIDNNDSQWPMREVFPLDQWMRRFYVELVLWIDQLATWTVGHEDAVSFEDAVNSILFRFVKGESLLFLD